MNKRVDTARSIFFEPTPPLVPPLEPQPDSIPLRHSTTVHKRPLYLQHYHCNLTFARDKGCQEFNIDSQRYLFKFLLNFLGLII